MKNRKIIYGTLLGLLIVALILAGIIFAQRSQELKVIFVDVGQGDAILIEQGSKQILIDGGPSGQALLNKLGQYVPFWDRNIELVITTHPDADHITGLVDVMKNYQVGAVLETKAVSESQIFQKYREMIQAKNISVVDAERGEKINLSDAASLEIFNPGPETPISQQDTNATSIVAKLSFGDNSFLFTGDLPSEQETELISKNMNLASQVLKVAHHGSKYSTMAEFLDAVKPKDSIISVGKNNRYGHPAPEILDRLKSKSINIFRTDETGDIGYACGSADAGCAIIAN